MSSSVPAPIRIVYDVVPSLERWYLDDGVMMPVTPKHDKRADVVKSSMEGRVRREQLDATIGANIALRWMRENPRVGVDPDVYWVEPALPPGVKSLLTWKKGFAPPRVAVEIVSEDNAEKDYFDGPQKYGASGTRELWVFDPERYGPEGGGGPYVLQVWRRAVKGEFKRVYAGDGPAFSRELGVWLVVVDGFLRISNDALGKALWPTVEEERQVAEAKAAESAAKAAEAEARATDEREARTRVEAKLRALEAELARRSGATTRPRARPKR